MASPTGAQKRQRRKQLSAIFAVQEEVAGHILESCNWNVETASTLLADGAGIGTGAGAAAAASVPYTSSPGRKSRKRKRSRASQPSYDDMGLAPGAGYGAGDEDGVRAPIAHFHDQLVEAPTRRMTNVKRRVSGFSKRSDGRRDLSKLFRPPDALLYHGTFQQAMQHAKAKERYLLVNVQKETEFQSHALNRDVWNDVQVGKYIKANLVFWQQHEDLPDGQRFCKLYKVHKFPFVGLVDPRTSELLRTFTTIREPRDFFSLASDYLTSMPYAGHETSSHAKASARHETMTEDELLKQALAESLREAKRSGTVSPEPDYEYVATDSETEVNGSDVDNGDDLDEVLTKPTSGTRRSSGGDPSPQKKTVKRERNSHSPDKKRRRKTSTAAPSPIALDDGRCNSLIPTSMPDEPPAGKGITRIQFRTPQGRVVRRFNANDPVRQLFVFIALRNAKQHTAVSRHPDAKDEFDLMTLHPAASIREHVGKTLTEANLLQTALIMQPAKKKKK